MEDKRLRLKETLPTNMEYFIQAFTEFYGPEYADEINTKLRGVMIFPYLTPDDYVRSVNGLGKELTELAVKKFFVDIRVPYNEENRERYFDSYYTIEYILENNCDYSSKIGELLRYVSMEDKSDYTIKDMLNTIEELFGKKVEYQSPEYNEILKQLAYLKPHYDNMIEFYKEIRKQYEQEFAEAKKIEKLKRSIKDKYQEEFKEEILSLLPKRDYLEGTIKDLTGYFRFNTKIEAFDNESNENLINGRKFIKESIKKDRISFLKSIGIDLGDNYEVYLQDERVTSLLPELNSIANTIKSTKTKYDDKEQYEYLTTSRDYLSIIQTLSQSDLLKKKIDTLSIYANGRVCVMPNLDGEARSKPLLFIRGSEDSEIIDCTLIHELNHVFELDLLKMTPTSATFNCGWDPVEDELKDEEETLIVEKTIRPYELLNEVVNDLIASDISKILHANGFGLIEDASKAKDTSYSSYAYANRFVRPFYEKYKKEIIASRHGDMTPILEKVGKENFERYNAIIREFLTTFSRTGEYNIYNAIDCIKENKESPSRAKYEETLQEVNECLKAMEEYSLSSNYRI